MMVGRETGIATVLMLASAVMAGQELPSAKLSPLVAARIVAVEPMPANLDKWIVEDLRAWHKYTLTADPEGANLVIKARAPGASPGEEAEPTVPRPDRPGPRKKKPNAEPAVKCDRLNLKPVMTIDVTDWITGEKVWYAHLFDQKARKDEGDVPSGPHADLFVRNMTPDQIAQRVTTRLREYVSQLEAAPGRKP